VAIPQLGFVTYVLQILGSKYKRRSSGVNVCVVDREEFMAGTTIIGMAIRVISTGAYHLTAHDRNIGLPAWLDPGSVSRKQ
jgi:hypothetical protein